MISIMPATIDEVFGFDQSRQDDPKNNKRQYWVNTLVQYLQSKKLIANYNGKYLPLRIILIPISAFIVYILIRFTLSIINLGSLFGNPIGIIILLYVLSPVLIRGFSIVLTAFIATTTAIIELCKTVLLSGFGIAPWVGLFSHVSVESTPIGTWKVLQLHGESGFKHSTHSNPEALLAVELWLEEERLLE